MRELEERIRELAKDNISVRQIAKQLGIKRSEVQEILEKRIEKPYLRKMGIVGTAVVAGALALYTGISYLSSPQVSSKTEQMTEEMKGEIEKRSEEMAEDWSDRYIVEGRKYTKDDFRCLFTDEACLKAFKVLANYVNISDLSDKDGKSVSEFVEKNADVIKKSRFLSDIFTATKLSYEHSKQAEKELPGFLEYVDKNWGQIYDKIVGEEYERGGIFIKKNGGHELVFKEDPGDKIVEQYVNEMLHGDFSHEKKLVEFVKRSAKAQFNTTETKAQNLNYSENDCSEKVDSSVSLVTGWISKLKLIKTNPEKFKNEPQEWSKITEFIKFFAKNSYNLGFSKELFEDSGMYFRWHHHPVTKKESNSPSEGDKVSSKNMGPEILFAVYPDKMEVYSTILGESKLERTYKVK